eukprot:TRINITY_DN12700_c0_g1_i1.p1 TRINITY_DN12700_c0_g1~~TRINITY_DN12700_c0_g1_i1.p1  ORF type:complete len:501 (+),score=105.62 TRINITY_DN12700_c0_g1_i1:90-1592(+)
METRSPAGGADAAYGSDNDDAPPSPPDSPPSAPGTPRCCDVDGQWYIAEEFVSHYGGPGSVPQCPRPPAVPCASPAGSGRLRSQSRNRSPCVPRSRQKGDGWALARELAAEGARLRGLLEQCDAQLEEVTAAAREAEQRHAAELQRTAERLRAETQLRLAAEQQPAAAAAAGEGRVAKSPPRGAAGVQQASGGSELAQAREQLRAALREAERLRAAEATAAEANRQLEAELRRARGASVAHGGEEPQQSCQGNGGCCESYNAEVWKLLDEVAEKEREVAELRRALQRPDFRDLEIKRLSAEIRRLQQALAAAAGPGKPPKFWARQPDPPPGKPRPPGPPRIGSGSIPLRHTEHGRGQSRSQGWQSASSSHSPPRPGPDAVAVSSDLGEMRFWQRRLQCWSDPPEQVTLQVWRARRAPGGWVRAYSEGGELRYEESVQRCGTLRPNGKSDRRFMWTGGSDADRLQTVCVTMYSPEHARSFVSAFQAAEGIFADWNAQQHCV